MNIIESIILAVVEGITEYLPVSSTGHLLVVEKILGLAHKNPVVDAYTVSVQLGAILAVVVLYWKKFFQSFDFYVKLGIGFLPTGIIGLTLDKLGVIEELQSSILLISLMFILVGFVLILSDRWYEKNKSYITTEITYKQAFVIGCFQSIAIIPGVSRSAAAIFGGLAQKMNRKVAAEYSFLLAVPTIFVATIYKLYKNWEFVSDTNNLSNIAIGNVVAFFVALLTVRAFVSYIQRNGLTAFGVYRIIIGILIFAIMGSSNGKP
jgi:undecaprenyl-diphosphatase